MVFGVLPRLIEPAANESVMGYFVVIRANAVVRLTQIDAIVGVRLTVEID